VKSAEEIVEPLMTPGDARARLGYARFVGAAAIWAQASSSSSSRWATTPDHLVTLRMR